MSFLVGAVALAATGAATGAHKRQPKQQNHDFVQGEQPPPTQQRTVQKKQQRQEKAPRVVAEQPQPRAVQQPQEPRVERARQPRVVEQPQQPRVERARQPRVVEQRQPAQERQPVPSGQRLSEPRQKQLIADQQQRLARYNVRLDAQQRLAQQRTARLQQQNRMAQYRFQEEYLERLREQQLRLQNARDYDYYGDPYFYTAPSYRYSRSGRYYETNQYGADLLRQAVNNGYEEGYRAGLADREDRWGYSYRDSYAYQDANYGYGGFYVDQDAYNYYFRQGFQRGYDDSYYTRNRYGDNTSGTFAVLGVVLSRILNLESLR